MDLCDSVGSSDIKQFCCTLFAVVFALETKQKEVRNQQYDGICKYDDNTQ